MADGLFYWDSREPFSVSSVPSVTLSTTDLALYRVQDFPVLGGQYFARPGKKLRIKLLGGITTAATPGNGTFDVYYGSGAAANGTLLASSAAFTLIASQTNLTWWAEFNIKCLTVGGSGVGVLLCTGQADFNPAVVASTNQPIMIPASAPGTTPPTCDLTAANIISVQFKRSGSTAETMQVVDMDVVALN